MADRFNTRAIMRERTAALRQPQEPERPGGALQPRPLSTRDAMRQATFQHLGARPLAEEPASGIKGVLGGALRGLASALEPLQLPQDAMFAVIAGALDKESTIGERLRSMKLGDYAPGGEAPERPASGEEIFSLLGFNEQTSKWAGLASDLVVDPLVFGIFLRGVGKLGKIDELVKLGDRFDTMLSPLGVAREVNQLARRSASFSAFQDARMAEALAAIRNPDSTVFGIQRFGEKATAVARHVLPQDRVYQLRFGAEAGRELFAAQRRGAQAGRVVAEEGLQQLQRSMFGVNGDQNKQRLALVIKSLEDQGASYEARLGNLRPLVREVVEDEVYGFAQQQKAGVGVLAAMPTDPSRILTPELRQVATDARAALRSFTPDELTPELAETLRGAESAFETSSAAARQRITKVARDDATSAGLGAEAVEQQVRNAGRAFDDYLRDTLMIDARIGFHTSGYGFVRDGVTNRVLGLGGSTDEAQAVWARILKAGLLGGKEGVDAIREQATGIRLNSAQGVLNREAQRRVRVKHVRLAALEAERARYAQLLEAPRVAAQQARAGAELLKGGVKRQAQELAEDAQRYLGGREAELRSTILRGHDELPAQLAEVAPRAKRLASDALGASTATRVRAARQARAQAIDAAEAGAGGSGARQAAAQAKRERAARKAEGAARVSPAPTGKARTSARLVHQAAEELEGASARYLDALDLVAAGDMSPRAINRVVAGEEAIEKVLAKLEERLVRAASDAGVGPAATHPAVTRLTAPLNDMLQEVQSLRASVRTNLIDPKRQAGERLLFERGMLDDAVAGAGAHAKQGARNIDAEVRRVRDGATDARAQIRDEYGEGIRDQYGARRPFDTAHRKGIGDEAQAAASAADPSLRYAIPERMPAVALDGVNTTLDDIASARLYNAARRAKTSDAATVEEALAAPVTIGELLDALDDIQALHIGDYLQGVMNGHLRKAYGLFVDGHSFQRYIDHLQNGRIIASNVIDEVNFRSDARFAGLEREVGLFEDYLAALQATGNNKVLRRDNIAAYLGSQGVTGASINRFLEAMHGSASNSRAWHRHMQVVREQREGYEARLANALGRAPTGKPGEAPRVTNRAVFSERELITPEMAEALGEHALASMSVLESADYGRRVISRQEAFQNVYLAARERGFIKNEPFTDQHGAVYRQLGSALDGMGGFGGKYVHPHLVTEVRRMSQVPKSRIHPALARVRSLLTGGYLASPAVLSANVVGGFYQAATAGLGPATMARRMAEVLPDMRAYARGEANELTAELARKLDIDFTTLVQSDQVDDFARVLQKQAGLGPEGAGRLFDEFATAYENFLQAPGVGRVKARWAGLEGFQFTENWFKVAAYKEMKERLTRDGLPGVRGGPRTVLSPEQVVEHAAEFARTVVFDYSTLPETLDFAKKYGVLMFPGFPYYLAGRTVGAVLERPGVVAVSDRISEAFMNAGLSAEEQVLAYLGMPEWLREEQGAPLPLGMRSDPHGHKLVSMIPMAQLVPTSTVWDGVFGGKGGGANPWGESIAQLGLWGPIVDIIGALATGDGEAAVTGRYGHKVFEPGSEGAERAGQIFRFLHNTMAPSVVRKGLRVGYQGRAEGLLPAIPQALLGEDYPEDFLAGAYSIEERRTGRPEAGWREWTLASFLRTPQVIALTGPLAGIRSEMDRERTALNQSLAAVRQRRDRARAYGENAYAEQLLERERERTGAFNERWGLFSRVYREAQAKQRGERTEP